MGQIIFEFFAEFVCHGTGRFLLPLISMGKARSDNSPGRPRTWRSPSYWRDGRTLVFSDDATTLIGIVFWVCFGLLAYGVSSL